ncbi:MAG: protein translocase subunit SecD [Fimbriimonadaceae bacterium]
MQSRSYYFLLIVLGLGLLAGFLYWKTTPKYGLDVKGGVRFTFQVMPVKRSDGTTAPMDEVLPKVQTILQNRIQSVTGVAEGNVIIKGEDQLVVEIPGYTDADKAQEQIGTNASLKGYWAKNVKTEHDQYRTYAVGGDSQTDASGNPIVTFTKSVGGKEIKPGDPEYAQMISEWQLIFSGQDLASASSMPAGDGKTYIPEINLTPEAGDRLYKWSSEHRDRGEQLAFVLDGKCIQIAPVRDGQAIGRTFEIDRGGGSGFPPAYVSSLTGLLNAGALPADLSLLSRETVDPTIGANALSKMIFAGAIAFAVISLFLIVYYSLPGFVALIALMLYVLFTLTTLKLMGATFSLAAIAGFVLSVGMAVDANILVFERFKEEIKKGKPLHNALDLGFKRALPAIVDSNACSILTSMVLATIGSGPVRGFATTLIIGVVISLFTAVTVTRSLLFFCTDSFGADKPQWYGLNRNWFGEHLESEANTSPLQIVNNARKWFTITAVVLAAGVAFMAMGGLKPGVEFTGGYEAVYERTPNFPSAHDITATLAKNGVHGANVKFGSLKDTQLAYITVPGAQMTNKTEAQQAAFLSQAAALPAGILPKSTSNVGPVIQKETTSNAITGVLFSFALIVVYLGFRFGLALGSFTNGLRFGVSAILAGAKDIVVIFGVAAAFGLMKGWELSSLFITAMLTVIGFSVHDKIVIFDRVRENLRHPLTGETFENLMNRSVTQSFARSINTAAAVCVMLLILILFGTTTPELSFFCVTMFAGIAWGTYSSIYTAAPVLNLWENWIRKHKGEQATLLATSLAEIAKNRVFRTGSVVPTSVPTAPTADGATRTYGQVKRRASAVQRSHQELDD